MKNFGAILALCAFQPSAAFVAPTVVSFKSAKSAGATPSFSYLAGLGATDGATSASDLVSTYYTSKTDAPKVNGDISSPKANDDYTKKLEQRLAALERQGYQPGGRTSTPAVKKAATFRDNSSTVQVQGGSLKTWSFASPSVERVQVRLQTEGRPLDADIELWQGPDNTPHKIRVYVEDGRARPFNCVMMTPRGPNTIAIRNTGQLEFPMAASVLPDSQSDDLDIVPSDPTTSKTIQGGALRTYPFDTSVESVQILLKTDGRPLNAKIELLQGPNNNKMVIEVYTEDGMDRPFFIMIETPGSGNVVRVVNSATVEFPMTALVEPYLVNNDKNGSSDVVMGGDSRSMLDRQW